MNFTPKRNPAQNEIHQAVITSTDVGNILVDELRCGHPSNHERGYGDS